MGAGASRPEAARRAAQARQVRFNVVTKSTPEDDVARGGGDGLPARRAGGGFVSERDDSEGELGGFKAIRTLDLGAPGAATRVMAQIDLLAIAEPPAVPGDVGVGEGRFAMPFVTIEGLVPWPQDRLLVAHDNNFPFSVGRHRGDGRPDDQEFVVLQLPPR